MNYYEMMVILSPEIPEEEEKEQTHQIEELIKREGGILHFTDHWGKRKLAYPIKKKHQGYYEWLYVELNPSRIAEIDRKLKMSETVLRFMILRMENAQIESLQQDIARRQAAAESRTEEETSTETATEAATEATTEAATETIDIVAEEEPVVEDEALKAAEEAVETLKAEMKTAESVSDSEPKATEEAVSEIPEKE